MVGDMLEYNSDMTVKECIQRIIQLPWQYECKWGTALWYEVVCISENRLHITFKGGQFRKSVRTQYRMDFVQQENSTKIVLRFEKDLFGMPAMTLVSDIDLFMQQKINATRDNDAPQNQSSNSSKLITSLCICMWLILLVFGVFVVSCSP